VGLSNGVNIKWLAVYCGTSVAMIEKHYGKYIRGNVDEQFHRLLGVKPETLTEFFSVAVGDRKSETALTNDDGVRIRQANIGGPTWIRTRDQPVMSYIRYNNATPPKSLLSL